MQTKLPDGDLNCGHVSQFQVDSPGFNQPLKYSVFKINFPFTKYCEILLTALPSQSHRRGNGWADGEAEAAGDFILS